MFRIFRAALAASNAVKAEKLGHVDLSNHYKARSRQLLDEETKAQELAARKAEIKAKLEQELANLRG